MKFRSFYQIIPILFFSLILVPASVSAYYLTLEAPAEVRVGEPVMVTGTTNVPPPDRIDIVFSHSINIPVEIDRQSMEITEKGDTIFNVTFNTTGLEKGNYKVEAISQTQRDFSGGSKNLRVVKLTDRSDIIRFSSPGFQEFEGKLFIEARIQDYSDNAIQIEVKKGDTTIFGPESIPVTRALVKYELPIEEPGNYAVIFYDYKGFIGSYPIQAGEEAASTPTQKRGAEEPDRSLPEPAVEIPEGTSHSAVTATQTQESVSGLSPAASPEVTTRPSDGVTPVPSGTGEKASAESSRDSPAYFQIHVTEIPVTIETSDNEDWVMEYKTSQTDAVVRINDQMKPAAERFSLKDDVKDIFLKVYPYSYKTGSEVTITADNAESVFLSDEAAMAFNAPPRYGRSSEPAAGKSPAPLAALFAAIAGAALLIRRW